MLARLQNPAQSTNIEESENWPESVPALLVSVDDVRNEFYSRVRRLRIGSGLLRLVQDFMTSQGYKGLDWDQRPSGISILDVMVDVLRGKLGSGIKFLGTMVKYANILLFGRMNNFNKVWNRKLKTSQLSELLEKLHVFFHSLSSVVRSNEEEARAKIVVSRSALPEQIDDDNMSTISSQLAESVGEWLTEYLKFASRPYSISGHD